MMDPPPPPSGSSVDPQVALRLQSEILARHSLLATMRWVSLFLSTVKDPPPPLPALASTAHFRLLSTDFSNSLSKSIPPGQSEALLFPMKIADVQVKSYTLTTNVPVQVLDIEDIGSSRWSQIEAIERIERGEEVRGREVIRNVPGMNESEDGSGQQLAITMAVSNVDSDDTAPSTTALPSTKKSHGPHRVLLSDSAHTKVQAFELVRVPKIFITNSADAQDGEICIGTKMLLKKGTLVQRGMVMLRPENVVVMGGKVEVWDQKWRERRKQRFIDVLQRNGLDEE